MNDNKKNNVKIYNKTCLLLKRKIIPVAMAGVIAAAGFSGIFHLINKDSKNDINDINNTSSVFEDSNFNTPTPENEIIMDNGKILELVKEVKKGIDPIREKTVKPTTNPTNEAEEISNEVNSTPTPEVVVIPSVTSTPEPTIEPTPEPTVAPTAEPTIEPTATPEATPTPTATPTAEPSSSPDVSPSPQPTPDHKHEFVLKEKKYENLGNGTHLDYERHVCKDNDGVGYEVKTVENCTSKVETVDSDLEYLKCGLCKGETTREHVMDKGVINTEMNKKIYSCTNDGCPHIEVEDLVSTPTPDVSPAPTSGPIVPPTPSEPVCNHDFIYENYDETMEKGTCSKCGEENFRGHKLGDWTYIGEHLDEIGCGTCDYTVTREHIHSDAPSNLEYVYDGSKGNGDGTHNLEANYNCNSCGEQITDTKLEDCENTTTYESVGITNPYNIHNRVDTCNICGDVNKTEENCVRVGDLLFIKMGPYTYEYYACEKSPGCYVDRKQHTEHKFGEWEVYEDKHIRYCGCVEAREEGQHNVILTVKNGTTMIVCRICNYSKPTVDHKHAVDEMSLMELIKEPFFSDLISTAQIPNPDPDPDEYCSRYDFRCSECKGTYSIYYAHKFVNGVCTRKGYCGGIAENITPEPTPELSPEPQPTPELTPAPTPELTPEPTLEPQPTPELTPEPTPELTPDPTPELTPEPTPEPLETPEPEATAEPRPTPEQRPKETFEDEVQNDEKENGNNEEPIDIEAIFVDLDTYIEEKSKVKTLSLTRRR